MSTTETTDAELRASLIRRGLLPDPHRSAASWSAPRQVTDPRVKLHLGSIDQLAIQYQNLADSMIETEAALQRTRDIAGRRADALAWLAQEYDLDAIALEVINAAVA